MNDIFGFSNDYFEFKKQNHFLCASIAKTLKLCIQNSSLNTLVLSGRLNRPFQRYVQTTIHVLSDRGRDDSEKIKALCIFKKKWELILGLVK